MFMASQIVMMFLYFQYLWKKTGLDSKVVIISANLDPRSEAVRRDRKKLVRIFKKVPRNLFVRIYRKYQPDYELFGYDFNEILVMAGHEPLTNVEREIKPFQ